MRYRHPNLDEITVFLRDFGMTVAHKTESARWFKGYGDDQYVYYAQKGEKKSKKRPSGASHANTPGSSAKPNGDSKQYSRSPPPFKALKDVSNYSTPTRPSVKQQPRRSTDRVVILVDLKP